MKYAGAFIILSGSLLFGSSLCARSRRSCDVGAEILRIMKYVEDQIFSRRVPTPVLLSNIPTTLSMRSAKENGLYDALSDSLGCLSEEERRIFSSFCSYIGMGTADAQRAGFDPLIERFTAELSARAEESRGKNRVYTACSLFFGVCAVIIFL